LESGCTWIRSRCRSSPAGTRTCRSAPTRVPRMSRGRCSRRSRCSPGTSTRSGHPTRRRGNSTRRSPGRTGPRRSRKGLRPLHAGVEETARTSDLLVAGERVLRAEDFGAADDSGWAHARAAGGAVVSGNRALCHGESDECRGDQCLGESAGHGLRRRYVRLDYCVLKVKT
jgi:hypothetical protein